MWTGATEALNASQPLPPDHRLCLGGGDVATGGLAGDRRQLSDVRRNSAAAVAGSHHDQLAPEGRHRPDARWRDRDRDAEGWITEDVVDDRQRRRHRQRRADAHHGSP